MSLSGWLKRREFISHSFGDWKSEIKVPAWLGSGEGSLPGLLLGPHMVEKRSWLSHASSYKALTPSPGLHSQHSQAPFPNDTTLGIRVLT